MKKRRLRYPATVAFRTTNELKDILETKASSENKTVSEVLQVLVNKSLTSDFLLIYHFLVSWAAEIRGKDNEWIKKQIDLHHSFMVWDAHHGYTEKEAIQNIKGLIEVYLELAKENAFVKEI